MRHSTRRSRANFIQGTYLSGSKIIVRDDVILPGQDPKKYAQHIASIHGYKLKNVKPYHMSEEEYRLKHGFTNVLGIPLTDAQYIAVLKKAQEYPSWNSMDEEARKAIVKNTVQMNFPKSTWQFISQKERETYQK